MDREISSTRRWGIEEKDMEEIFDISNEIELLKEIKDIQDELNILRTLFAQQSRVVKSYHRVSGERIRSSEMVDAVARLSTIVEKMDIDAQRPYKAVSCEGHQYQRILLLTSPNLARRPFRSKTEASKRGGSQNYSPIGHHHYCLHRRHHRILTSFFHGGFLRVAHSRVSLR
jgi:hypothetical protein